MAETIHSSRDGSRIGLWPMFDLVSDRIAKRVPVAAMGKRGVNSSRQHDFAEIDAMDRLHRIHGDVRKGPLSDRLSDACSDPIGGASRAKPGEFYNDIAYSSHTIATSLHS